MARHSIAGEATPCRTAALGEEQQASLAAQLQPRLRANTFDEHTGNIVVSADRAAAIAAVQQHYTALFGDDPSLRNLRKAYAMKEAHRAGRRQAHRADCFRLVVVVVGRNESPGRARQLHEQLAARSARRQHSAVASAAVDSVQRVVPDRRHRAARLAPCKTARRGAAGATGQRSAGNDSRDALDAGDREILLAGDRAVPDADPARSHHRALSSRRPGGVRLRALQHPAVLAEPHLAHAARRAVDRDRVARHGPVHRSGDLRSRAALPASRRQLPVRVPAHHRRRRVHRTVACSDAEARPGQELLVRPPGLGVRGPRALLADGSCSSASASGCCSSAARCGPRSARAANRSRSSCCCSSPPSASGCSTAPG